MPRVTPESARCRPYPTTSFTMSRDSAPSDMHMPISWVRGATEYAITPQMPMAASSSANPANTPTKRERTRDWATAAATMESQMATLVSGRLEINLRNFGADFLCERLPVSLRCKISVVYGHGTCTNGKCRSSELTMFNALNFTPATTPITSRRIMSRELAMCLPTGFLPGRERSATV
jgi:hypothetical protein